MREERIQQRQLENFWPELMFRYLHQIIQGITHESQCELHIFQRSFWEEFGFKNWLAVYVMRIDWLSESWLRGVDHVYEAVWVTFLTVQVGHAH